MVAYWTLHLVRLCQHCGLPPSSCLTGSNIVALLISLFILLFLPQQIRIEELESERATLRDELQQRTERIVQVQAFDHVSWSSIAVIYQN